MGTLSAGFNKITPACIFDISIPSHQNAAFPIMHILCRCAQLHHAGYPRFFPCPLRLVPAAGHPVP